MLIGMLVMAGMCASSDGGRGRGHASEIKSDERVVFFPTAATYSAADGGAWTVPVHGWIFEPEEGALVRSAGLAGLKRALAIDPAWETNDLFLARARSFLVDNERGKTIGIQVGRQAHYLKPSEANGHFFGEFTISAEQATKLSRGGLLSFKAITSDDDPRAFRGRAILVGPEGLSVISDIDDTIKISDVTDTKKLIRNTFYEPFRPAPGMAAAYRRLAQRGASFHFVSSSPWQLYEPLAEFTAREKFPPATFHLKHFRAKDSTLLDLLADPLQTKPVLIESILSAYPARKFLLIGDSGEKDPEVYGLIARRRPDQIQHIYIRNVTDEDPKAARFIRAFENVPPTKWTVFTDASAIR